MKLTLFVILPIGLMVLSYFTKKFYWMAMAFPAWLFMGIYSSSISTVAFDLYWLLMFFSYLMSLVTLIMTISLAFSKRADKAAAAPDDADDNDEDDDARIKSHKESRTARSTRIKQQIQEARERRAFGG